MGDPPTHTHTEGGPTPSPLGGWPPYTHTHTHTQGGPTPSPLGGWNPLPPAGQTPAPAGLAHRTVSLGHDVGDGIWLMIAYIVLFSALLSRLTAFVCGSAWVTSFYSAFFWISTEVVYLQRWHGWCHMKLWFNCGMLHTHWVPCWPHTQHRFPRSWCGWWYGSTVRCYIHTGYPLFLQTEGVHGARHQLCFNLVHGCRRGVLFRTCCMQQCIRGSGGRSCRPEVLFRTCCMQQCFWVGDRKL